MPARVNSWNEWDPLKRVIVGRIDSHHVGAPDPGFKNIYPELGMALDEWSAIPDDYLERAHVQMEGFVGMLESRGVQVDRPTSLDDEQHVQTPDWEFDHTYGTMPPRDVLMCHGNEILEATMSQRARWFESFAYRSLLEQYFKDDPEFYWTAAPKPRLTDESYVPNYWENFFYKWTPGELDEKMHANEWHLTEKEPLFDAADAIRFGKDIFIQHAAATNKAGIDWFKRHFEARGFRVHVIAFAGTPQPWHIDVTVIAPRAGLLIQNPNLPPLTPEFHELFRINDWEIVETVAPSGAKQPPYTMCHENLGFNTFSLDPNTIFVEENEVAYMEQLSGLGFEVIPVPFLDVSMFGGGLHCSTVDVHREGELEDYFPRQIPGF